MTAFSAILAGQQSKRGDNIKDRQPSQRKRDQTHFSPEAQAAREASRWSDEGFVPQANGEWSYTWEGVGFPAVEIVKDIRIVGGKIVSGFFAKVVGSEISEVFGHNSHPANIATRLDDIIYELMQLQADEVSP